MSQDALRGAGHDRAWDVVMSHGPSLTPESLAGTAVRVLGPDHVHEPAAAHIVHLGPGLEGLDQLNALARAHPGRLLVAWADEGASAEQIRRAFEAGARAFISAPPATLAKELDEMLHALTAHRKQVDSNVLKAVASLTPRQKEVLRYVAQGLDNLQIAAHLSVCERTVKTHITSLYRKLAQENRVQLALVGASAMQNGLTDPDPDEGVAE